MSSTTRDDHALAYPEPPASLLWHRPRGHRRSPPPNASATPSCCWTVPGARSVRRLRRRPAMFTDMCEALDAEALS
ncbi:hypothetical protein [Streptomyces sp. NRRL F-5755]|uniref:hypothetical protein n=1 Tax=Streptomyces sp. NRRL F-5755 TaxID=1519475 RepID=UPI000A7BEB82|nr:hypothetical protein [Streptomyces sp. NRRL F-5755]